jgi:hypothetical protein
VVLKHQEDIARASVSLDLDRPLGDAVR